MTRGSPIWNSRPSQGKLRTSGAAAQVGPPHKRGRRESEPPPSFVPKMHHVGLGQSGAPGLRSLDCIVMRPTWIPKGDSLHRWLVMQRWCSTWLSLPAQDARRGDLTGNAEAIGLPGTFDRHGAWARSSCATPDRQIRCRGVQDGTGRAWGRNSCYGAARKIRPAPPASRVKLSASIV
jgi:hypothetical protein